MTISITPLLNDISIGDNTYKVNEAASSKIFTTKIVAGKFQNSNVRAHIKSFLNGQILQNSGSTRTVNFDIYLLKNTYQSGTHVYTGPAISLANSATPYPLELYLALTQETTGNPPTLGFHFVNQIGNGLTQFHKINFAPSDWANAATENLLMEVWLNFSFASNNFRYDLSSADAQLHEIT